MDPDAASRGLVAIAEGVGFAISIASMPA